MKYQQLLVTLHKSQDADELIQQTSTLVGVFKVGKLVFNPDIPEVSPYFFVYVEQDANFDGIAKQIAQDPNVASASAPAKRHL